MSNLEPFAARRLSGEHRQRADLRCTAAIVIVVHSRSASLAVPSRRCITSIPSLPGLSVIDPSAMLCTRRRRADRLANCCAFRTDRDSQAVGGMIPLRLRGEGVVWLIDGEK